MTEPAHWDRIASLHAGRTQPMGLWLLLGSLSLAACITLPMEWKKDGVKSDQVKYDKAVCEYNAELQAGPVGSLSSDQRAARKEQVKKLTNLCMTSRGYKLEAVPIEP
jgi:hypothetical protein